MSGGLLDEPDRPHGFLAVREDVAPDDLLVLDPPGPLRRLVDDLPRRAAPADAADDEDAVVPDLVVLVQEDLELRPDARDVVEVLADPVVALVGDVFSTSACVAGAENSTSAAITSSAASTSRRTNASKTLRTIWMFSSAKAQSISHRRKALLRCYPDPT